MSSTNTSALENKINTLTQAVGEQDKELQRLTKEIVNLRRELTEKAEPSKKEHSKQIYAQVMSTIAAVGALGALITSIIGVLN